jgi:hypothetical protein
MAMLEASQLVMVNHGKPFEDMARDIVKVVEAAGKFAGAVVIVPPEGAPIAFITMDPAPDLMQFWSAVKNRVEIRAAEAEQSAQQSLLDQMQWGRR